MANNNFWNIMSQSKFNNIIFSVLIPYNVLYVTRFRVIMTSSINFNHVILCGYCTFHKNQFRWRTFCQRHFTKKIFRLWNISSNGNFTEWTFCQILFLWIIHFTEIRFIELKMALAKSQDIIYLLRKWNISSATTFYLG
jgi:hypothetical protein